MFNNQLNDFQKLQRFESLDNFNQSFYIAMKQHKDSFSKGELIALKTLKNWGAKIFGVVYAKLGTIISDLIKRKGESYSPSRSTFERAIRKAKKLGILTVVELKQGSKSKRRKNLKANNLYLFGIFSNSDQLTERNDTQLTERKNPETSCPQSDSAGKSEKDTVKPLDTSLKDLKSLHKNSHLDSSYVKDFVPNFFVDKMNSYYDADTINDSFLTAVRIFDRYYQNGYGFVDGEMFEKITSEAINSTVWKERKEIRKNKAFNTVGYFVATVKKKVEREAIKEKTGLTDFYDLLFNCAAKTPAWL